MFNFKHKLKIVIFDRPCDHWTPLGGEMFAKMVGLKLSGFGREYKHGALPVDTTDFIGTHLLVCLERNNGLVPVMGYKSVSLETSKHFNVTFPALGLVQGAKAPGHVQAVEAIIKDCEDRGAPLAYTGSWTVAPFVKNDDDLRRTLKDLTCATLVFFHQERGIGELISGGTVRFKVDRLIGLWGHEPLTCNGHALGPISAPHLCGEKVLVMHLKNFTKEALATAAHWEKLWDSRLTINLSEEGADVIVLPRAG